MRRQTLFITVALATISLLFSTIANAQNLSTPYFCGFEDATENANWVLNAGPAGTNATNKWYISDAEVYAGDSALNISNTQGTTATYANTTVAIVAYRTITLAAGTYDLSFTYYAGGEGTYDGLYACWVNGTQTTNSSAMSAPSWVNSTAFTINTKKMQNLTGGWKVATQSITSTGAAMKLVFVWVNNGSNSVPPGGCIDNVQICTTSCGKPTNVTATANGQTITVTWSGNASSYDLQYRSYGSSAVTTVTGIVGNSYTITGVGEGVYDFLVRSNCPGDTSIYVITQNVIVYDASAHCIDYVNLTASGTTCTYGTYSNPQQSTGVVDNGPSAMSSRHTVHYTPGETDPRTANGLPTIPKGEVMSVRLGNWDINAQAETVTYTYTVPANSNVIMILKYAVVFEEPGHAQPPEFNMKITDLSGQSIGSCTEATFLCDGTLTDATWHTNTYSYSDIWWKEWTQVGFNLSQYAGQTLKICFTTKDCNYSGHFGYAYFCLSCTEATITGLSCGAVLETSVQAPDGFNYQWYKKSQPGVILGTDRTFSVTGADTSVYVCKVINKANPNCFFTLEASLLPRNPNAQFTPQWTPSNCENKITLLNTSSVVTSQGVTSEKPEYYEWYVIDSITGDTVVNGLGTESPVITLPNEGGDYVIELVAAISGGMCQDTLHILYNVPEIHEVHDTIDTAICQGKVYIFNGNRLTTTGQYEAVSQGVGGCDSTVTLNLTVVDQIETDIYDSICYDSVYVFNGNSFTKAGDYKAKLTSSAGCDSIITLHLTVHDPITFTTVAHDEEGAPNTGYIEIIGIDSTMTYSINGVMGGQLDSLGLAAGQDSAIYTIVVYNQYGCPSDPQQVILRRRCITVTFPQNTYFCADDKNCQIPFTVLKGVPTTYDLTFDSVSYQEKRFRNVRYQPIDTTVNLITITLPTAPTPRADTYTTMVGFHDTVCGTQEFPVTYTIKYSNNVIEQRWNDVLAVLNNKLNYPDATAGYDFIEFQWYKNGQIIPGETGSYLYLGAGNVFDAADNYSVELKRVNETFTIMSCPMNPTQHFDRDNYLNFCTGCTVMQRPSQSLALSDINEAGIATWYSVTGQMVSRFNIDQDNYEIETPAHTGAFILEVICGSTRQTFKVYIAD